MRRTYGNNGTIHDTQYLDVETDEDGDVVAIWFRCMALPFRQSDVNPHRGADMRNMYADPDSIPELHAVEIEDGRPFQCPVSDLNWDEPVKTSSMFPTFRELMRRWFR